MCIQELTSRLITDLGKVILHMSDALSRHPLLVADVLQVEADASRTEDVHESDIAKLQRQDDKFSPISQWLEGGGLLADPHQAQ